MLKEPNSESDIREEDIGLTADLVLCPVVVQGIEFVRGLIENRGSARFEPDRVGLAVSSTEPSAAITDAGV